MTVHQLHRTRPAWTYGDRLRKIRRENHLTQVQLAEALGFSSKSIDAWESDRNLPGKLVETSTLIEDHFGLVRGWMLGYADGAGGALYDDIRGGAAAADEPVRVVAAGAG